MVISIISAAIVAALAATLAQSHAWLPADEIARALTGKTIEGRYASGRPFTERYFADGRLEYSENGQPVTGHWSVTAGTLCTIYDTDPAGGCFHVTKSGSNCFEFYFASRTEEAAPGPDGGTLAWTARGAVRGESTACRDGANV